MNSSHRLAEQMGKVNEERPELLRQDSDVPLKKVRQESLHKPTVIDTYGKKGCDLCLLLTNTLLE